MTMTNTVVRARIDQHVKEEAAAVLAGTNERPISVA